MTSPTRWQQVGGSAAEVYQRQLVPGMFAPWAPTLMDLAAVRAGERVLDVACGTGVVTRVAAERVGSAGRCVGLDINEAMLAMAGSLPLAAGAPIEWLAANALALPFADAAFDVVLCQHGLPQFPERPTALREMRRVLASAGRLVVCVWSRIEGNPGMVALVAALERHVSVAAANNRRAPFALGDAAELRELLVGAGFGAVELQTLVKTARFPSAEQFVQSQFAATPLSTLGAFTDEARQAVQQDVLAALEPYVNDGELAVPMEALVARGRT